MRYDWAAAPGGLALQEQMALAALEADGPHPLHLQRELAEDVLVDLEDWQVVAVQECHGLATNGAGQHLQLGVR